MHSLSSFSGPSASGSGLPGFGLKPTPFLFLLLLRSDAPDRQPASFYTYLYFPGRPIRPVASDTGIRNRNPRACVTRSRKIGTPACGVIRQSRKAEPEGRAGIFRYHRPGVIRNFSCRSPIRRLPALPPASVHKPAPSGWRCCSGSSHTSGNTDFSDSPALPSPQLLWRPDTAV